MEPEIRCLERGLSLFVEFDREKDRIVSTGQCEFEGGCQRSSSKIDWIFSGPPPTTWGLRIADFPLAINSEILSETLLSFGRLFGDQTKLHYTAVSGVRLVAGNSLFPNLRPYTVWALTGYVPTLSGRMVPIGWSGQGDGLARLLDDGVVESLIRMVEAVDKADNTAAGWVKAVLSPEAAAVILHEAVGHFAEASVDAEMGYRHRIGCRIASEIISIHDDPLALNGPAQYELDDEGVACLGPTQVVRDGVLIAQLHSIISAKASGAISTANGRSASIWDIPIPRISNLICVSGTQPEGELLENMGTGLYIHQLADGFKLGSSIEASIVLAEWIRDGKQTGCFLTGGHIKEQFDLLTRAVETGNISMFCPNSMCGKAGQLLFDVGTCAPAIRFSRIMVI